MTDKANGNGSNIITLFPNRDPSRAEATAQQFQMSVGWNPELGSLTIAFDTSVEGFGLRSDDAERLAKTILSYIQFKEPPFHRDALFLPVDAEKRKKEIDWVIDHPLWSYPVTVREPPTPEGRFGALVREENGQESVPILFEGPDWHDKTYMIGGGFYEAVRISFHHVDPLTECIQFSDSEEDEDDPRNIASRVWIEAGPWYDCFENDHEMVPEEGWNDHNKWDHCHDIRLDCGGPDWDTALVKLAQLVRFFYNDDGTEKADAPQHCEGSFENDDCETGKWVTGCRDAGDGYCETCGFIMGWHQGNDDEE